MTEKKEYNSSVSNEELDFLMPILAKANKLDSKDEKKADELLSRNVDLGAAIQAASYVSMQSEEFILKQINALTQTIALQRFILEEMGADKDVVAKAIEKYTKSMEEYSEKLKAEQEDKEEPEKDSKPDKENHKKSVKHSAKVVKLDNK